ncbi:DUF2206 domain-containing protein [Halorarius litoreus]|uniref:DUF2206 domain-containing protein n=1 Tax=Halorarius litoreus TaxID=2962676 RepID=UPI0020CFB5A9|nr:DUF2206 domain-containing protein [Halorarius litoreus]
MTVAMFCFGVASILAVPQFKVTAPLFIAIILICLSPVVFLALTEQLSDSVGVLALFSVSLLLLYHNALATEFLFGRDIAFELYHAQEIIRRGSLNFDMGINPKMNALLPVTLLAALVTKISGTSLTWTYKVAYPIVFALTPVFIFRAARHRHDAVVSYAAALLFTSYFFYFTTGLENIKQSVSILFIAILGLSLARRTADRQLQLLAVVGLVLSHYGIPYIVLFGYLSSYVFLTVTRLINAQLAPDWRRFSLRFGLMLGIGMVTWHAILTSGEGFRSFVLLGYRISESVGGLFGSVSKSGTYYATSGQATPSFSYQVMRYFYIASQALIVIGFLGTTRRLVRREEDLTLGQYTFAGTMFTLLAVSVIVPAVLGGFSLGLTRMYQISLIFISIFFGLGAFRVGQQFGVNRKTVRWTLVILLVFLLLFNTRVVMETNNRIGEYDSDYAASLSLSQTRINAGMAADREVAGYYRTANAPTDVRAARWIEEYLDAERRVITDDTMLLVMYGHRNPSLVDNIHTSPPVLEPGSEDSLLYRTVNTKYDIFIGRGTYWDAGQIQNSTVDENLVYTTKSTKLFE